MKKIFCFVFLSLWVNMGFPQTEGTHGMSSGYDESSEFNPENPGDPAANGTPHWVRLNASPEGAGTFEKNNFQLGEGQKGWIETYGLNGYKFVCWKQDGKIVSTDNPLSITMGTDDLEYTATFIYSPQNPKEPGANPFNSSTGELLMDNFEPGDLYDSAWNATARDDDFINVKSLKVVGVMKPVDYRIARYFKNCELFDYSQASGCENIPAGSFRNLNNLNRIIFPTCINSFGTQVFSGCNNLSEIVMYAPLPPSIEDDSLEGLPTFTVVRVPATALPLYQAAKGWKNLSLKSLDGEICTLYVDFPEGISPDPYANMTIELKNLSNSQAYKSLVTNRSRYIFPNLIKGAKYNISLKKDNYILGEIKNVEISEEEMIVAFTSLLKLCSTDMTVLTPEGGDVTEYTEIKWWDTNMNFLDLGDKISNIPEGEEVFYEIKLNNSLLTKFDNPSKSQFIVGSSPHIDVNLKEKKHLKISGKVKDSSSLLPLGNVKVSFTQSLNAKDFVTLVAVTNADGLYETEVLAAPLNISYSKDGYVSHSKSIEDLADLDSYQIPDTKLSSFVDSKILVSINLRPNQKEGVAEKNLEFYTDYNNVTFAIKNLTSNKIISNFKQDGNILSIYDKVNEGDRLLLTASSRKGLFDPSEVEIAYRGGDVIKAELNVVERGGVSIGISNLIGDGATAFLYNNYGYLYQKKDFNEHLSVSFDNLENGKYTLMVIESSDTYNYFPILSYATQLGLIEDIDMIRKDLIVEDGIIKNIIIENLPKLTTQNITYLKDVSLRVNSKSVVTGNYITVTAKSEFFRQPDSDSYEMVFNIPNGIDFVEGSMIIDGKTNNSAYKMEGRELIVSGSTSNKKNVNIKFCVVPVRSGTYYMGALARYLGAEETIISTAGSDSFVVEDLSFKVGKYSKNGDITAHGLTTPGAYLEMYDNNVLIGTTTVNPGGDWNLKCELSNPTPMSVHRLFAKIFDGDIITFSKTYPVIVDNSLIQPMNAHMIFYNHEQRTPYDITFDFESKTISEKSFMMNTGETFTFTVDCGINSPDEIKGVIIYVYTRDGNVTCFNAVYDETTDRWIASGVFYDKNTPINVSAECYPLISDNLITLERESVYADVEDFKTQLNQKSEIDSLLDQMQSALNNKDLVNYENILSEVLNLMEINIYDNSEDPDDIDINDPDFPDKLITGAEDLGEYRMELSDNEQYELTDNIVLKEFSGNISELDFNLQDYQAKEINTTDGSSIILYTKEDDYILVDNSSSTYYRIVLISNSGISTYGLFGSDYDMHNLNVREAAQNLLNIAANVTTILSGVDYTLEWLGILGKSAQELRDGWETLLGHALCVKETALNSLRKWVQSSVRWKKYADQVNRIIEVSVAESKLLRGINNLFKWLGPVGALFDLGALVTQINETHNLLSNIDEVYNSVRNQLSTADCKEKADEWEKLLYDEISPFRQHAYHQLIENVVINVTAFVSTVSGVAMSFTSKNQLGIVYVSTSGTILGSIGNIKDYVQKMNYEQLVGEFSYRSYCIAMKRCNKNNDNDGEGNGSNDKDDKDKEEAPLFDFTILKYEDVPNPFCPDLTPNYDPSGFVYEAIPSNRIEGVKATCFYKDINEDINGEVKENAVVWDAEEYGQVNPQYTNKEGYYRWDVPEGLWQVKYEKEGYETAFSDWLPVPPPQLEVNIGLTKNKLPEIKSIHAYKDGIMIEFSEYMMPSLLNPENIMVSQNGTYISGYLLMLNEESSYENEDIKFASKVRFVPQTPFSSGEVTILVSNQVRSYTGNRMQENFQQTFDIESEINAINVAEEYTIFLGDEGSLTVEILPADASKGKILRVESGSPAIVDVNEGRYTIGDDGLVEVRLWGGLPGSTTVFFSIEGYDVSAHTNITVKLDDMAICEPPIASIPSESFVTSGTQVSFTCATEKASIYYTIDGSCPCDFTESAILYDGTPVTITNDITIMAIATAQGMYQSEVVEFKYFVSGDNGVEAVTIDNTLRVYPLTVRDNLNISAGDDVIKNISLIDINGFAITFNIKPASNINLDVSNIPCGYYLLRAMTSLGIKTCKIIKVD